MTRLVFALFLSGCIPALVVEEDNPRRSVPEFVYAPPAPLPEVDANGRCVEVANPDLCVQRFLAAQKAREDAQERAEADAKDRAAAQARASAVAVARRENLCKASDDDRGCLRAYFLREDLLSACALAEEVRGYQADVAYQWREGKKYGVVDVREVESAKGMAQAKEDDLADVVERIKAARGKPFSQKHDCKS